MWKERAWTARTRWIITAFFAVIFAAKASDVLGPPDADRDGVADAEDCSPNDRAVATLQGDDTDCDGTPNKLDCSPENPKVKTQRSADSDCDGTLDAEDCAPGNSKVQVPSRSVDSDCDGILNAADCNPTGSVDDLDCDGAPNDADCAPNDKAISTLKSADSDCDGTPTEVDCAPNDPKVSTTRTADTDCNGVLDGMENGSGEGSGAAPPEDTGTMVPRDRYVGIRVFTLALGSKKSPDCDAGNGCDIKLSIDGCAGSPSEVTFTGAEDSPILSESNPSCRLERTKQLSVRLHDVDSGFDDLIGDWSGQFSGLDVAIPFSRGFVYIGAADMKQADFIDAAWTAAVTWAATHGSLPWVAAAVDLLPALKSSPKAIASVRDYVLIEAKTAPGEAWKWAHSIGWIKSDAELMGILKEAETSARDAWRVENKDRIVSKGRSAQIGTETNEEARSGTGSKASVRVVSVSRKASIPNPSMRASDDQLRYVCPMRQILAPDGYDILVVKVSHKVQTNGRQTVTKQIEDDVESFVPGAINDASDIVGCILRETETMFYDVDPGQTIERTLVAYVRREVKTADLYLPLGEDDSTRYFLLQ